VTANADISAPTADWLDPVAMNADPYPSYKRLREESPVAWVPALNQYLATSYHACRVIEENQETFSAAATSGTSAKMSRALGGQPMVNKDDPAHAAERRVINPGLRPKTVRERWMPVFAKNARTYLEALREKGRDAADLNHDFAAPVASQNLIDLLGFKGVHVQEIRRWSNAFVGGVGNMFDDAETWQRNDEARAEVDAVLAELVPFYRRHPDESITSALANSGASEAQIAANVNLTITGGMNEPQHAITSAVWALSHHRDQRQRVLGDSALWPAVFDETVRWISPIGMYPRQTTREATLEGVILPAGSLIGVVVGAANRDATEFEHAEDFDIMRTRRPHLAFGSGVHMCAGHWAARIAIGEVAVPLLYEQLPGLRPDSGRQENWFGWFFRGLVDFPVTWN
jgi:cytochrome P450